MERGDNVVLGNMCENLPHEMVPITKFSAFSLWTIGHCLLSHARYLVNRARSLDHYNETKCEVSFFDVVKFKMATRHRYYLLSQA